MKNFTTKKRQDDNKVLIDAAEKEITEANERVGEALQNLEQNKDEGIVHKIIPVLDNMRDQTRAYANRNALVIATRFRQVSKAVIALAIVVFLIGCLFGGLVISFVEHNNGETQRLHQTSVATRFAGSYNSCLNSNVRSKDAGKTLAKLFKPGAHPYTPDQTKALLLKYNQEVVPLRNNVGNVFTEPLPNPIPLSWKKACAQYAYKQITTVIPKDQLPPKVPVPAVKP